MNPKTHSVPQKQLVELENAKLRKRILNIKRKKNQYEHQTDPVRIVSKFYLRNLKQQR